MNYGQKYFNSQIWLLRLIVLVVFFYSINLISEDKISGGILGGKINGDYEDYGAYITFGRETDTLFFTSSRPVKNKRKIAISAEIFFSTRNAANRESKKINEGWSKAKQIVTDASRISKFTRGSQAVTENLIIFAAERDLTSEKARGTSYLFDLWEMTRIQDKFSKPKPLQNVNRPDSWESQPALSQDLKILYFVSNRQGGKGGLDIWYSVNDYRGIWTKPLLVPNINTEGDEISPHCGADGKFYFSSNWNFKENRKSSRGKDIYRADYKNVHGFALPVNPINLDDAIANDAKKYNLVIPQNIKYNSEKDDEFPFITDDRKGIFLTSNREDDYEKRNIFSFSLPKSKIRLIVRVREKILDVNGEVIIPATPKIGLNLLLVDKSIKTSRSIKSGIATEVDANKDYTIQFSKFVEEECYHNRINRPENLFVHTEKPFGLDTLYERDVLIVRQKVEIPPIILNSTDTLPYFITGYWYPNTTDNIKEYRKREANGFFDRTGFVDSASTYNYDEISLLIEKSFEQQIYEPLEEILPSFQDFCRDTLYLKVTVHGYTDPRGLSAGLDHSYRPISKNKREYPDESITVGIDERGQPVKINSNVNMWNYHWPLDNENKEGLWIKLANKGEKGNILLSKLRAYFTFVTFDKVMRKRSPIYSNMRDNGKVILDAEGFGIDKIGFKERGLKDDPQSRRIEIYLDILRPEELANHKRLAGGNLKYHKKIIKKSRNVPIIEEESQSSPEEKNEYSDDLILSDNNYLDEEIETENDFSDEDEIAEKYKTIDKVVPSKPILTSIEDDIEEKIIDEPIIAPKNSERDCYKIYYQAYKVSKDAQKAKLVLIAAGVDNVRIVEIFDSFGSNRSFELYSGCYSEAIEAINAMKSVSWATKALKLKRKPVIIR